MIAKMHQFHHRFLSSRLRVAGLALLIFGAGIFFASNAFAASSVSNSERLITIHDGAHEVSVVTRGNTIGDALKQADISLSKKDIVEPMISAKLVAKSYQVNIFRARPVLVVDGKTKVSVMTAEQSSRQIMKQAGLTLYDEDKTTFERVDDVLESGGAGLKLIIKRAIPFSFNLYGKEFVARTQATTVGGMMKEKGIQLGPKDGVSPVLETPLVAGISVRIWRDGKQTLTQEMVIPKPVEEMKDLDHEVGYRAVKTPGADGKRNVTFEIEMKDGVEVARKEIASVTVQEPVKEVVVVGAKSRIVPYTGGGNKDIWLAASGIPREDWGYVDAIVQRESGWNPNATNTSSGACGLAQALPCSKVPGNPYDPVDSLRWMNTYVTNRYYDGSPYARGLCAGITSRWACAHTFWSAYHWY